MDQILKQKGQRWLKKTVISEIEKSEKVYEPGVPI